MRSRDLMRHCGWLMRKADIVCNGTVRLVWHSHLICKQTIVITDLLILDPLSMTFNPLPFNKYNGSNNDHAKKFCETLSKHRRKNMKISMRMVGDFISWWGFRCFVYIGHGEVHGCRPDIDNIDRRVFFTTSNAIAMLTHSKDGIILVAFCGTVAGLVFYNAGQNLNIMATSRWVGNRQPV